MKRSAFGEVLKGAARLCPIHIAKGDNVLRLHLAQDASSLPPTPTPAMFSFTGGRFPLAKHVARNHLEAERRKRALP